VLNLCIIAAAALATPYFDEPVLALGWGVIAGGILQLAIQWPPLASRGFRLRWRWAPRHDAVRRSLRLMAPMIFGAAVYQINVVVSTILASMLPEGSVSYLWYAGRVFEFPLGIFAVSLVTAALPTLSAQASRQDYEEMVRSLSFSLRLTSVITIPATIGLVLLALPITSVLFQRGAFGFHECSLTASALAAYAVGLWAVSQVRLVAPAFYALGDTQTPVITAAVAFVVNLIVSLGLMGPVDPGVSVIGSTIATITHSLLPAVDLRHVGLALATSVSAMVNLVLLVILLRRRLPQLRITALLPSFARPLLASLAMIPPVLYVQSLADWQSAALIERAAVLLAAVIVGMISFGIVALVLGGDEVAAARRLLSQRLTRSRSER
jgi:putative peptidoglycan lipid II flippase